MRFTRLLWISAVLMLGVVLGMRPAAATPPAAPGLSDRAHDAGHGDVHRPTGGAAGLRALRRDPGWHQATPAAQTGLTGTGGSDHPPAFPATSTGGFVPVGGGSGTPCPTDDAFASASPPGPGCRGPPNRA